MKNILIILFLIVSNSLFAQKYLQLIPEIAPDSAGCNGKAKAIMYGGIAPYNVISLTQNYWDNSTGTTIEGLCDGSYCVATFVDDQCSELNSVMKIYSDTSKQIYLDTVIITMPSSQSNCNGQITLVFRNIQPYHTMYFGGSSSGFATSSFSFTGLCSDRYYYSISSPGSTQEFFLQMNLRVNPVTCIDFDASIEYTPVQDTANCTGEIHINASGGSGGPFAYDVYHQVNGLVELVDYTQSYTNFRDSLCVGPYMIDVFNNYNNMRKRFTIYLDTYDNDSTWNEPDTLLPDTDTIILNALANCAPNYLNGIDTAFISSITLIGNSQYEFGITIIQGSDTVNAYGNAIVDTSLNFFIDLTLFCEDTLRSMDSFNGKRNLIYHGIKLQSTASVPENAFFSRIEIFPNPFEDKITLNYSMKESALLKFELSDITGKIVYTENYYSLSGKNQRELNLENLNSGMYFMNVYSESKRIHSRKIIRH
jgi:hypothetical protein